jgi:dTDP-4-amino-4,6-dideoxygalactose transaminase
MSRIEAMLDRRWLSNDGPLVREFENKIVEITGVPHCIAMCNAKVALELAARAIGLGGEVIVPSYTFVATAHALQWQGITPVFADIDPKTHNIDVRSIEREITERTTGIVGVHLWGRPCDTDAIESLAEKHGLKVMYDAAHAFGASHQGRMIGGFGACEIFSFHATKFINSFEGGAVVTHDADLARRLRLMRNFGFEGFDNVTHLGVNGKLTEVCAAMGLTSLESMDAIISANARNYRDYCASLGDLRGISLLPLNGSEKANFQYVVLEVDERATGVSRDALVEHLHSRGVLARKYFWPGCHRMEPYRSRTTHIANVPNTDLVAGRVVVLPTGQAVSESDVERVCTAIREALA